MPRSYLLDASALLAVVFEEAGRDMVAPLMSDSAISAVNYSEVIARQMRKGADGQAVISGLDALGLDIIPWDQELAEGAFDLNPLGWTKGISLGDRVCLATARHLGLRILTADKKWLELSLPGIDIQLIR
jgi:ribonuclease VapC